MIKELESYSIEDRFGNVYGKSIPTNIELMDKINEIIRYINAAEEHEK